MIAGAYSLEAYVDVEAGVYEYSSAVGRYMGFLYIDDPYTDLFQDGSWVEYSLCKDKIN